MLHSIRKIFYYFCDGRFVYFAYLMLYSCRIRVRLFQPYLKPAICSASRFVEMYLSRQKGKRIYK